VKSGQMVLNKANCNYAHCCANELPKELTRGSNLQTLGESACRLALLLCRTLQRTFVSPAQTDDTDSFFSIPQNRNATTLDIPVPKNAFLIAFPLCLLSCRDRGHDRRGRDGGRDSSSCDS